MCSQIYLGMPIDQQMQRQDDGRHAGHPEWDGGRTSTSCAEWQGHQNVCSSFQRLLKSRDIHFFTSENDDIKWPMVEHFQRILQGTIHCHILANRTQCFMDVLPALLCTYNTTHHTTPHVTVPLAWCPVQWTGPMGSTSGSGCTQRDACCLWQALAISAFHPVTMSGWAMPVFG